jgi:hypothetical protein
MKCGAYMSAEEEKYSQLIIEASKLPVLREEEEEYIRATN